MALQGLPRGDGVGGHVLYDHAARADDGVGANAHAGADGHVAANPHVVLDDDLEAVTSPVGPQLVVDRVAVEQSITLGPMSTNWGWLARDTAASSSCPTKLSMKESASPTAVENRLCRTMGTARGRSSRRKLVLFAAFPCSILPHPLSTTVYGIGAGGCQHRISGMWICFIGKVPAVVQASRPLWFFPTPLARGAVAEPSWGHKAGSLCGV